MVVPGGASHDESSPRDNDPACAPLLRMPVELLVKIFEYLPQTGLGHAAGVSRSFNEAARHAGRCIHRRMHWNHFGSALERSLERLNDLIDYVLQRNLRLSLSISIYLVKDTSVKTSHLALPLLAAITRSLPRLVSLSIRLKEQFLQDIYLALCDPAPLLCTLKIISDDKPGQYYIPVSPGNIFASSAPRLRTLGLRGHTIVSRRIPAFTNIRTLLVEELYESISTPLWELFPHLSCIHVYDSTYDLALTPLDLSRLHLRVLVMRGTKPWARLSALRNLHLDEIAEVHVVSYYAKWTGPLWERDIGDFAVHLRVSDHIRGLHVSVIPEHRPWRFVYHMAEASKIPRLDRMPQAARHLASVRMDNMCVDSFLKCGAARLDALRELCVDLHSAGKVPSLIWPPDCPEHPMYPEHRSGPTFDGVPTGYSYVRCPALEKVAIFALDTPMIVHAPAVAFLGRALGLLERPELDKPVLALVRVNFVEWTDALAALLARVFLAVEESDFVGHHAIDDYSDVYSVSDPTHMRM
ncbi:hypothetical protein AURDEDRAFT_129822 [Auricularia subglabra TFB-10046 SS5]|nr:hypothetical protein AURDEDRAFT_129822 [Auricularia subglabra TFB-10046 SS5]